MEKNITLNTALITLNNQHYNFGCGFFLFLTLLSGDILIFIARGKCLRKNTKYISELGVSEFFFLYCKSVYLKNKRFLPQYA